MRGEQGESQTAEAAAVHQGNEDKLGKRVHLPRDACGHTNGINGGKDFDQDIAQRNFRLQCTDDGGGCQRNRNINDHDGAGFAKQAVRDAPPHQAYFVFAAQDRGRGEQHKQDGCCLCAACS